MTRTRWRLSIASSRPRWFTLPTGLDLLRQLDADKRIAGRYRLDAVRAHLHEMRGDRASAVEHFRSAAKRTAGIPEREYLLTQAAWLLRGGDRSHYGSPITDMD